MTKESHHTAKDIQVKKYWPQYTEHGGND